MSYLSCESVTLISHKTRRICLSSDSVTLLSHELSNAECMCACMSVVSVIVKRSVLPPRNPCYYYSVILISHKTHMSYLSNVTIARNSSAVMQSP